MTWSHDLINHKNRLWHKMDGKNKKIVSKLAKLPRLRPLGLKSKFLLEFEFLKNYKDLYGKCCRWARSAHQYFPYKSFKFLKNSSCLKNSLCNVRRLKSGHFHIFAMLFSFLASVLYHDHFWWLTRSCDRVMQRAYYMPLVRFLISSTDLVEQGFLASPCGLLAPHFYNTWK